MTGPVFLKGEKVELRTIEREDLEFLRNGINRPEVRINLTTNRPQNMENEDDWFEEAVKGNDGMKALMICNKEQKMGVISLEEKEDVSQVAEIGIWLKPEFHGNGYGTEASELIIDYGFDQLELHRIQARVQADNEPSRNLWEKLGFEKEGRFREHVYAENRYKDVVYYGLLEGER